MVSREYLKGQNMKVIVLSSNLTEYFYMFKKTMDNIDIEVLNISIILYP